jgi:hypothetical protein
MRAPRTSPVFEAHAAGTRVDGREFLDTWVTSGGSALPRSTALSSAISLGSVDYALINLVE